MQAHREKRAEAYFQGKLPQRKVGCAPGRVRPKEGHNGGRKKKDRAGSLAVDETLEHGPRVGQKSLLRCGWRRVFHPDRFPYFDRCPMIGLASLDHDRREVILL